MAMSRSVLFRTDCSVAIGTGHLHRCLAVAAALRAMGVRVSFAMRDLGLCNGPAVTAAGHSLLRLPPPARPFASAPHAPSHAAWAGIDQETDALETIELAQGTGFTAIVVDHYAFDAPWHEIVCAGLGAPIVAIDDLGDRRLAAATIVDHNLSPDPAAKHSASLGAGTRLLSGPRFAMIDAAYATAPRYRFRDEVASVGIFMGGIDALELSLPIGRALREDAGFTGAIAIATSSSNPHLAALEAGAAAEGFALHIDQPNLAAFFATHDLQIGAAGGATWERCCIGAPAQIVAIAANQRAVTEPLALTGAIGIHTGAVSPASIAAGAAALIAKPASRRALHERSLELVDGHGAARVAAATLAQTLAVRPATRDDSDLMYAWRNDARTRAVSRDADPIPLQHHRRWLGDSLASTSRTILIAEIGTRPVGVVRFDHAGDAAEVSIYLDPLLGGIGLGPAALAAGEQYLACCIDKSLVLKAETLPGNRASRRLFEGGGYETTGNVFRKRLLPAGNI
jgi:UDP-2,4-diacetamido-2,4,6-trideoxy-beta-L-altropyranose hydrolase